MMWLNSIRGLYWAIVLFAVLALGACTKEPGPGGEAEIRLAAMMPDSPEMKFATFYLKYGVDECPGTDLSLYDAHASTSSHSRTAKFTSLRQGKYYVYCIASDNGRELRGGRVVRIFLKRQSSPVNVWVKP
jgi:hypothetical protein